MVDLTVTEKMLITRLARSFEIKMSSVPQFNPEDDAHLFHVKEICLVILHAGSDPVKAIAKIRWIKKILTMPVPLLVLMPEGQLAHINKFMKAGADDFIAMPLNEESFAMRFYVLLECGQAILNTQQDNWPDKGAWHLIMGYVQEGIRFFAPKSQLAQRGRRPISNRWTPVEKLATGGDAEIWLVRELGKERTAVAKIPHLPRMNINALRGAAVLKRLVYHPNIVHLIEVIKEDKKFILIQEYIKGMTLWDLLGSTPLAREKEALFRSFSPWLPTPMPMGSCTGTSSRTISWSGPTAD